MRKPALAALILASTMFVAPAFAVETVATKITSDAYGTVKTSVTGYLDSTAADTTTFQDGTVYNITPLLDQVQAALNGAAYTEDDQAASLKKRPAYMNESDYQALVKTLKTQLDGFSKGDTVNTGALRQSLTTTITMAQATTQMSNASQVQASYAAAVKAYAAAMKVSGRTMQMSAAGLAAWAAANGYTLVQPIYFSKTQLDSKFVGNSKTGTGTSGSSTGTTSTSTAGTITGSGSTTGTGNTASTGTGATTGTGSNTATTGTSTATTGTGSTGSTANAGTSSGSGTSSDGSTTFPAGATVSNQISTTDPTKDAAAIAALQQQASTISAGLGTSGGSTSGSSAGTTATTPVTTTGMTTGTTASGTSSGGTMASPTTASASTTATTPTQTAATGTTSADQSGPIGADAAATTAMTGIGQKVSGALDTLANALQ